MQIGVSLGTSDFFVTLCLIKSFYLGEVAAYDKEHPSSINNFADICGWDAVKCYSLSSTILWLRLHLSGAQTVAM
jgi:hypothetical protein